jgi:hypothetical protein
MTTQHHDRCLFYGDATLPQCYQPGHSEYGPEDKGFLIRYSAEIPRELWGKDRYDHGHLLPWVPVRPEDKPCGQSRNEGQGSGVALITHTASFTVLGCWDYTGDDRGNSWSLFWIRGRLSANEMVAAIKRDFPCLWTRITARGALVIQGGEVSPPPAKTVEVETTAPVYEIPDEFFARRMGETIAILEEPATAGASHNNVKTAGANGRQ